MLDAFSAGPELELAAAAGAAAAAAVESFETTRARARFSDFSRSFSVFNDWSCCSNIKFEEEQEEAKQKLT